MVLRALLILFVLTYGTAVRAAPLQPASASTAALAAVDRHGTASAPHEVIAPTPAQPAAGGTDRGTEFWPAFCGYRLKVTDTLVALFTLLLFAATWLLYRATKDLVAGAADTAERQLRAYVSIVRSEIACVNPGGTPVAKLWVKNSGQTPAYSLNGMGGIAMGVTFDSLPAPTGGAEKTVGSLAPGATDEQFHTCPRPLTETEVLALIAGRLTIWVYGKLEYIDAFKKKRITEYRLQVGGNAGIQGNQLAICQEGNKET